MAPAGRRSSRSGAGTAGRGHPPAPFLAGQVRSRSCARWEPGKEGGGGAGGQERAGAGLARLSGRGRPAGGEETRSQLLPEPRRLQCDTHSCGRGCGKAAPGDRDSRDRDRERWRRKGRGARHRRLGSTECPPGSLGRGEERGKERQREGCGVLREVENNLRGEERNLGEAERDGDAEKDGV